MGGRFKGGDLASLRAPLAARGATVIAIGEARARLRDALASRGARVIGIGEARPLLRAAFGDLVTVDEASSLRDAVERAFELASPDGTVLLAPACSSFDMFRDYAERGRAFKEAVARLAESAPRRA
jgi:UDP-N-acetylmuramoylalanine--D-glutamate ligase